MNKAPRGDGCPWEYGDPFRHRAKRDATSPSVGGLNEALRLRRMSPAQEALREKAAGPEGFTESLRLWRTLGERTIKKPPTLGEVSAKPTEGVLRSRLNIYERGLLFLRGMV